MAKSNCTKTASNVQTKITTEEYELAKWFLDKEWTEAKERDNFMFYHQYMGWIFCNGFIAKNWSVLEVAFFALGSMKQNAPKAYDSFMTRCKKDLAELEPEAEPDNVIAFPAAGGDND